MSGLGLLVLNLQGGKIGGRWPQALPLGRSLPFFPNVYGTPPLAMKGGDPYIRALMRTITASEANVSKPYHVIYGGEYVSDLSTHPNRCILINKKSNTNQCSTAAGRYQFINTTWDEKAQRYHPQVSGLFWWKSYSFEPEYQDAVVYAWLSDSQGWGVDISQLLREGKIQEVLKLLSGTWTSLGYGKETNFMSRYLPQIYQNMLAEELKTSIYSQSK
ncbi:MAG: glycoside hydrolase family protein [Gomphosphaeria aponina SAG 52.96 = DSM 107014]|uniref:Glycoside hydrolase family protein n=1 Tax=Gomphosphaeria aponina SAG 52.96 = DSM 107014 TaxID=1521640 RepID=A0A941GSY7_9CHRO|nr:glycoside hydrolase family protein [Gomphosphaeria aponina SAG 52.96 = DSM 107014]